MPQNQELTNGWPWGLKLDSERCSAQRLSRRLQSTQKNSSADHQIISVNGSQVEPEQKLCKIIKFAILPDRFKSEPRTGTLQSGESLYIFPRKWSTSWILLAEKYKQSATVLLYSVLKTLSMPEAPSWLCPYVLNGWRAQSYWLLVIDTSRWPFEAPLWRGEDCDEIWRFFKSSELSGTVSLCARQDIRNMNARKEIPSVCLLISVTAARRSWRELVT